MTPGRDDDALSWDGDDDPTLDVGAESEPAAEASDAAGTAVLPEGYTAVGRGSEGITATPPGTADGEHVASDQVADEPRAAMGNATLIALGVLGGIYLLFTVGWLIGGLRLQGRAEYLVTDVMYQGSFWLAVLAPLLWFGTVFLLTRRSPAWSRVLWLVAGAVLLVPWPFIMIGTIGQ